MTIVAISIANDWRTWRMAVRRRWMVARLAAMLVASLLAMPCAYAWQSDAPARLLPVASSPTGTDFHLTWDADAFDNLHGGIRTGYATDSLLTAGVDLDTSKLGWWQGGQFAFGVQAIASTHPSSYAGDLQGLSNIEAPNQRHVSKLWYAQDLGQVSVRGGIMDVNSFFDVTDAAGLFLNSSFGITPTIMSDIPGPSYPVSAWGLMVHHGHDTDGWSVGLFQGDVGDRSTALRRGALLIAERDFKAGQGGPQVGVGAWYRRAPRSSLPRNDAGAYATLQQALPGRPGTIFFAQLGASPGAVNPVPYYLAGGVHFEHVSRYVSDVGLAFARAWIRHHRAETSIEATASLPLFNGAWVLQPDVQYIVHPSGIYPNAFEVGLRMHVTLY